MRVVVAAVGRMKLGPDRELAARFCKRAAEAGRSLGMRPVEVVEVKESRARELDRRTTEESIALASIIPDGAAVVLLDEQGENLGSAGFAGRLQAWRDAGRSAAVFIIGGADGLALSLQERADLRLAFGAATWPHQLVRIMLLEQLYRAMTILSGHPYHRGQP
jgi:23S rRNA (pseudouridine1915-N3)-methyltransferase